jgi:hypothetical protein
VVAHDALSEANDVFTWLDGMLIVAYIAAAALVLSAAIFAALLRRSRRSGRVRNVWRSRMR